ncbi:TonB-dependent receptor [Sandaracinobacteroides saxicola]|uniref:TonB-dependent receptor n=1 Tax=Sandaracinobacteroides saxicola TaxID=2759707 RepID=A0A7G5II17_9SPHN|nr:TonB-dependent receptor [Sandaracinobacteroides saxicola]QMW23009.1 TonB-dependent receptor [Sandaracinobacteroides saxicola]
MRSLLLTSAALLAFAGAAHAQTAPATQPVAADENPGEIIVTATKRAQRLSDVPIAVSAVTAESLQNSGATDIRQLNQLSPSLLVSSTSSEAGAGVARIRGIGTVGDNPGLESSVAVFIDGVYRSRSGVGLTELGEIDRIEVLRGPQGTLFGRNASAGLINVITAQPKFETQGNAEVSYGNYDYWRVAGGITGGLTDKIAVRLDGVYTKRDGFIKDLTSGRGLNNRDRYLLRGKVLFEPTDDVSILLTADYASRKEECCASTYDTPFGTTTRDASGNVVFLPNANSVLNILNQLGGNIQIADRYKRETAITPGRGYQSDVKDYGFSGELNWQFGDTKLTSITAYRDWKVTSGQDADFMALDVLYRPGGAKRQFRTFSQELRLNGTAFDDRLDWLVGGYYADEKLDVTDNLAYGADYQRYANCLVVNGLSGVAASIGLPGLLSTSQPGCISQTVAAAIPDVPALAGLRGPARLFAGLTVPGLFGYDAVAAAVGQPGNSLVGDGLNDRYRQNSRNYAFFTHNVIDITDKLSLTLGARYTNERKEVFANLASVGNPLCGAIQTNPALAGLATLPCVINNRVNGAYTGIKKEDKFSGTVVVSFKPTDRLLTYASYSRGYKAGGFNLDRSALLPSAPNINQLTFEPETVNAFELGAKLRGREFNLNIAGFYQEFSNFQLNTFNGVNFLVENTTGCKTALAANGSCAPGDTKAGVVSKGVEIEANIFPIDNVVFNLGLTVADTKYRKPLVGLNGRPLPGALALLPGERLSNAPLYVATTSFAWMPPIGDTGMSALFYVDMRYQSEIRTGSDLFPEKTQQGFAVVNARVGLNGKDKRWSVEAWAQNLLNEKFTQVGFNTPLQGGGSAGLVERGLGTVGNTLFSSFLGEPRTYGITVKTKF